MLTVFTVSGTYVVWSRGQQHLIVIHQVACYNQLPRVNTVGHAFLYSEIDAYVISVIYAAEQYYIIIQDDNACV